MMPTRHPLSAPVAPAGPLLLAVVACAACASGRPAAPPADIQARVSRVFPKTESLSKSVLSVKVELYNPRSTPVQVGEVRYALDTGEVAGVVEGSVVAGARLAAEQQAEVGFDIGIPLPEDDAALEALVEREAVPAELSGTVRFGDGTTASFERSTGLAMPALPRFVVFDAQAARYGKEGLDVTFFLRLVNANAFTQPVQGVRYTVSIGARELRSSEAGVGARLTPGGAEEYEESVVLQEGLRSIMSAGKVDYRVKGEIQTREMTIPFDHEGKIALGNQG